MSDLVLAGINCSYNNSQSRFCCANYVKIQEIYNMGFNNRGGNNRGGGGGFRSNNGPRERPKRY
jgi:hypothetical protein